MRAADPRVPARYMVWRLSAKMAARVKHANMMLVAAKAVAMREGFKNIANSQRGPNAIPEQNAKPPNIAMRLSLFLFPSSGVNMSPKRQPIDIIATKKPA